MARILFATFEFHPTTWGGCGVLLRHATDLLLARGHEIVLLIDVPTPYFRRFVERDRDALSVPEKCTAYHVDALCRDLPFAEEEIDSPFVWKSVRFAHALEKVEERERLDFVEFFEYCGVGYHSLVMKRFGPRPEAPTLGIRCHNSVELIDLHEGTKPIDRDRAILYGLERAALAHAESVLLPSRSYADRYYVDRYALPDKAIVISEPPTVRFGQRSPRPLAERREIVFYGRIFEFKGVERFVRAALLLLERRPAFDIDFVLIGNDSRDGPDGTSYTEYLKSTIPRCHRERFVFTGHLDHEAVRERLGVALFAVFPNRFESFCYAAHEMSEAGVPMLIADIPAFRNYWRDGVNASFFDGTSADLARQMERLLQDPQRIEELGTSGRLALDPLGEYYDHPKPLRPIPSERRVPVELMVVVLVPPDATDPQIELTLEVVGRGLSPGDEIVVAIDDTDSGVAEDEASVREKGTAVVFLGRRRRLRTPAGLERPVGDLRTRDALLVLVAGDEPSDSFVRLCRTALERDPDLGFAGTWVRGPDGQLVADCFDVHPERYPFEHGARPTRCLLRTERDGLLVEAFEPQAGIYGEIAALWRAEERWGRGCLLPRPALRTSAADVPAYDPGQLAFLVQAVSSPTRRERLALLALAPATTLPPPDGSPPPTRPMSDERARRIASEYLNGMTLLRMAAVKLRRKLARGARRRPLGPRGS